MLEGDGLAQVPGADMLVQELRLRLATCGDDEEQLTHALSEFRHFHAFRVATAEVAGTLPLMRVSDYLTNLAEAVLAVTAQLAWDDAAPRFADVLRNLGDRRPFVVVGYGKLGGLELGHGSDLDIVFLHDLPTAAGPFLHRLVRRLMHLLSIRTHLGPLYEVDMRLRPGGKSTPLTGTLEGFRRYQQRDAWVWEHQALVRARVVAGDALLAERFAALRRDILCQERNPATLAAEILKMRERMHTQHRAAAEDLKRSSGGMVDIEFIVQYLVLAWAHRFPALAEHSDNTRILDAVSAAGVLPPETCRRLTDAYHGLRSEWHRAALDIPDPDRQVEVLAQHRDTVRSVWQHVFGAATT